LTTAGFSGELPARSRRWLRVCAVGIAFSVGVRILHYVPYELPPAVESVLGEILHYQIWNLILVALMLPVTLVVLAVILLLFLFRRRWCLYRQGGRWATRPWLSSVLWTLLLLYNAGLDLDPRISLMCWTSLPALLPAIWISSRDGSKWQKRIEGTVTWAAFFGFWLASYQDPLERTVTLIWAPFVILLVAFGNPRSWLRDRLWIALSFSAVLQVHLSESARRSTDHGGTLIGTKGYAYTFCEIAAEHKLFAAVPCDSGGSVCGEGYVAEHDTRDLARQVEHRFFSESFRGRLVHLVCLEDSVQVGMATTVVDGGKARENVMEFSTADPRRFQKSIFPISTGSRLAYDRRHGAIFYTSEWSRRILRVERKTGEHDTRVSDEIYGTEGSSFGSHLVENGSFHDGRDSLFFVQWLSGSKIFEIDRSTLELVKEYDPHHGGSHGIAVDDELNRIWVAGIWGIDVLEVGTGKLLSRARLGLGCRLPVIDRLNDIVYVPNSTGRLWALDRRNFAVLGSLLIGGGSRNPYVSSDGGTLFASALHGYLYWSTAELARRFRPTERSASR
jgi:hypothetical protein